MIDVPNGKLYLGEGLEAKDRKRGGKPVLLSADDLTTHGVIVGMTGSGKTGLGVDLIEESLLQGIPTLIFDPKGDLGNLLLTFPELRPEDFAPWVEDGDPAEVAKQWRDGLADWDIEPPRITALRDAAEFTIYTPGSTSGVPLNVVGSLRRPPEGSDAETVSNEVEGFVSGLLNMVGIGADPLSSREHILLSNLIENAWANGTDLSLADLVSQVQTPPLRKLGVYELEAFYPAKDRSKLAMTLNGLLASRAFAAWAEGPELNLDTLLKSADAARPACAIVSLSHLSDEERQFVVSLVLGKLITWMRRQAGTGKLRVLVYFDEVMGFVPPSAMPPAKKPILTLFKQARAFGIGIVLATQNPVDVDYKGLSNAGTWMIGRLQTEQDKARLLDGLSSAGGGVDVKEAGEAISSLGKREFMLRSAGSSAPSLFTTRWAMSYLRGPLTREQIAPLMQGRYSAASAGGPASSTTPHHRDPRHSSRTPHRGDDPSLRRSCPRGPRCSSRLRRAHRRRHGRIDGTDRNSRHASRADGRAHSAAHRLRSGLGAGTGHGRDSVDSRRPSSPFGGDRPGLHLGALGGGSSRSRRSSCGGPRPSSTDRSRPGCHRHNACHLGTDRDGNAGSRCDSGGNRRPCDGS